MAGIDVVNMTLSCAVRNAPGSATAFTLEYSVMNPTGIAHLYTPACVGALHNGAGFCTERYSAPVPIMLGKGSVRGKILPDELQLGPVTPREISAPVGSTPQPGITPVTLPPTFVPIG